VVLRFGKCFGDFEVSHGCLRHCVDDILLLKGEKEGGRKGGGTKREG